MAVEPSGGAAAAADPHLNEIGVSELRTLPQYCHFSLQSCRMNSAALACTLHRNDLSCALRPRCSHHTVCAAALDGFGESIVGDCTARFIIHSCGSEGSREEVVEGVGVAVPPFPRSARSSQELSPAVRRERVGGRRRRGGACCLLELHLLLTVLYSGNSSCISIPMSFYATVAYKHAARWALFRK